MRHKPWDALMAWLKVDDAFHSHPKVMKAGTAAVGLWVRCGSYSAHHLTDGVVPREVAKSYGNSQQIKALVTAGLWIESDSGYVMPDYLDYNPSREEALADRAAKHEKKVEAGRAGGVASGAARRRNAKHSTKQTGSRTEANGEAEGKQNEAPYPYPSRTPTPVVIQETSLVQFRGGTENSAEAVVAAFMSAAADAGLSPPGERTRSKVGRTALTMLRDGTDVRQLINAARSLALKPYDDLEKEVRIIETASRAVTAPAARVAHTHSVLQGAFQRASEAEGNTA